MAKIVPGISAANACTTISATRFDAPMMLVGRTALSVEMMTKRLTLLSLAASATAFVPKTLLSMPAAAFSCTMRTCL